MGIISYFCKHKGGKKMGQVRMLGALVGDIIGSTYEFYNTKRTDITFQSFFSILKQVNVSPTIFFE